MSAANLLVGSRCSSIYILRCDPNVPSIVLKTTIEAGRCPIQVVVDVPTKSFYALDSPSEVTKHETLLSAEQGNGLTGSSLSAKQDNGSTESSLSEDNQLPARESGSSSLLTLRPTEQGSIDVLHTLSLPMIRRGNSMLQHRSALYISTGADYAIVKCPAPSKSSRGRDSALCSIEEDAVAESLDELFRISKNSVGNPKAAIETIQTQISAEVQSDMASIVHIVEDPILKWVHWKGNTILGLTKDGVVRYKLLEDKTLLRSTRLVVKDAVDLAGKEDQCWVLTSRELMALRWTEEGLETDRTYPLLSDLAKRVVIHDKTAYLLTDQSTLILNLETGDVADLEIKGSSIALSNTGHLLFIADSTKGSLCMFEPRGRFLAECSIQEPADIIQMS